MILTQEHVESTMYAEGAERARLLFSKAEEKGRAGEAPYANRLYREYVLPLAAILREEIGDPTPGVRRAHAQLLAPLDHDTVAFLAVRTAINIIMAPTPANHRTLGYALGRTVHRELVLAQIEHAAPDLYNTLARDFSRRLSKDERHRMTVFQMQAKEHGIDFTAWGIGSRDQVGLYLLGKLETIGLVDIGETMTRQHYKREYKDVTLTPAVIAVMDAVKGYVAETSPAFGPCVEPPVPWTGIQGGGFHTQALRRVHRSLVKVAPTARPALRAHQMPRVLAAVNNLQATPWAVNERVLDVVQALAEAGREVAGVAVPHDPPKPDRPPWMDTTEKADMTVYQQLELKDWKRAMMLWYEERKLRATSYGRFYTATRQAELFRKAPELFFVYFLDSRGRAYPMTYGLNPQGADLQKALLKFAEGLPIHNERAEFWWLIHGANKFGFDKAKLHERAQWSRDKRDLILSYADAPLDNQGWLDADAPLQFLAWCFEYAEWVRDPGFVSHLPVSLDGSCNGLQHFSAMLRDPVGGEAVNLTNNESMQDIYGKVADATFRRMLNHRPGDDDEKAARDFWIAHGVSRDVVKRSVMTTPYGVTKQSAIKYVIGDYLANPAKGANVPRDQWRKFATYLMQHAWPAIGDVVVKSRQAMDWLRSGAQKIIKAQKADNNPDPMIAWETPSGFLATQCYYDFTVHRIRSLLHGDVRLRVVSENDEPDISRHAAGLAPNFVHSMDASHLHLVAEAAPQRGIKALAMIHDDYGTHAAHTETLFHLIREEFVRMYENHDPVQALADRYPMMGKPPEPGDLDIREVLSSDFFFS